MRLLVTGSTGFLGRALMPMLHQQVGHRYSTIECWARARHGDLLSQANRNEVLRETRPDAVIHLAWLKTGTATYEHDPLNRVWSEATVAFAQEATAVGARFIGIGSMIEDDRAVKTPYADAKRSAAIGVLSASTDANLSAWVRPSWIFSFEEWRPRVLHMYSQAESQGLYFTPNDPEAMCDFVHVQDVAGAIQLVLDNAVGGISDVSTECETSVRALLKVFRDWREGTASHCPETAIPSPSHRSLTRTENGLVALGWKPRESMRLLGFC